MDTIIEYFKNEINNYNGQIKKLEEQMNSKKIVSQNIEKAINKLIDDNNSTFHIFNVSGSNSEFTNSEVAHLKEQHTSINDEIENLLHQKENFESKLNLLHILLDSARKISFELNEPKKDVEYMNINVISAVLEDLRNASFRIEAATKISIQDYERCKMEIGLARMKILLCIDELSKLENVSRETS